MNLVHPQQAVASPAQPQEGALKVLVVEDDADTAESQILLLRMQGHHALRAPDGGTALRIVGDWQPDVVLLDLGLPGMDGLGVARSVTTLPLPRRPHLIAVTGYGSARDRQWTHDAGIDLHLVKPVDPGQLLSLLGRFQSRALPRSAVTSAHPW